MTTKLLFTENTFNYTYENAEVASVTNVTDKQSKIVVLHETIFYPQGGGQPSDVGYITNGSVKFNVLKCTKENDVVLHEGIFEPNDATFQIGEKVNLFVDKETRLLNASIHSAGHLLDLAVKNAGFDAWTPGKGYHFVQSPYVEYNHNNQFKAEKEMMEKISVELEKLLNDNGTVKIEYMSFDKATELIGSAPTYLPSNQPVRIVTYGSVSCPCSVS
jgi:Ser-tRNA(Ala) deacylase AlaX